jgi:hypothetical protein
VDIVSNEFKEVRKETIMLRIRSIAFILGLAMQLPLVSVLQAQALAAPIPSQLLTAKKVFISNAVAVSDAKIWTGGSAQPYNELYAALKSWGHYEIVTAPVDADLVLQISFSDTLSGVGGTTQSGPISSNTTEFSVVVLDIKTHTILWTINEKTSMGHMQKGRDQALTASINALVDSLKALTAPLAADK